MASAIFINTVNILTNGNCQNRDDLIYCISCLPTIHDDILYFIDSLKQLENQNWEINVSLILDILRVKKPNIFQKGELIKIADWLISMNAQFSNLSNYISFIIVLKLIFSSFPEGTDPSVLTDLVSKYNNVNSNIANAAASFFIREIANPTIEKIVNSLNNINSGETTCPSHLLIFALANILNSLKNYSNLSITAKSLITINNLTSFLTPLSSTYSDYIIYFLSLVQSFFAPHDILVLDQHFFPLLVKGIHNSEIERMLISQIMLEMPFTNDNPDLKIGNQISALLVTISVYMNDFESKFSRNIVEFAIKRRNDPLFIETLFKMASDPQRYTTAIFIGSKVHLFDDQFSYSDPTSTLEIKKKFLEICFPKDPTVDFFESICSAVSFLASHNLLLKSNIDVILQSIFGIVCNPNSKEQSSIITGCANAIKAAINLHFTENVFNYTVENIEKIVSIPFLVGLIQHIQNDKTFASDPSLHSISENNFIKCVSVAVMLAESKRNKDEKIALINFLAFLRNKKLKPEEISNITMNNIVETFIDEPNSTSLFETVLNQFEKNKSFAIVIGAIPNLKNDHIPKVISYIDSNLFESDQTNERGTRRKFVLFYKTRLFFDPFGTNDHIKKLINDSNNTKTFLFFKRKPSTLFTCAMLKLFTVISRDKMLYPKMPELGEFLEKVLPFDKESLLQIQHYARKAVNEIAKNERISLSAKFVKNLISLPMYSESIPFLLPKLPRNKIVPKKSTDAIVASKAWAEYLISHSAAFIHNDDIAQSIINYPEEGDSIIPNILSELLDEIEEGGYHIILFVTALVKMANQKGHISRTDNPQFLITLARYCFSKNEEERVAAFDFFKYSYKIETPLAFDNGGKNIAVQNNVEDNILMNYNKKHSIGEKIDLFIEFFYELFSNYKDLGAKVFDTISKYPSPLKRFHLLLIRAIAKSGCNISEVNMVNLSGRTFKSLNSQFEAQVVFKEIALTNMDFFIQNFCLRYSLNSFSSNVLQKILSEGKNYSKFLDHFIEILIRSDKASPEQCNLLMFSINCGKLGEIAYSSIGKLLVIVLLIIGLAFFRNNSLLDSKKKISNIISQVLQQIARTDNQIKLKINCNQDFDIALEEFSKILMKSPVKSLDTFSEYSKKCVQKGNEYICNTIGISFIHIAKSYSEYGSVHAEKMKASLWETFTKSLIRSSKNNRRLFAHVLNRVLTRVHMKSIPNISKNNIFSCVLESLDTVNFEDYMEDSIEIVCIFYDFCRMTGENEKLRDCFHKILNLKSPIKSKTDSDTYKIEINANILSALKILLNENVRIFGDRKKTRLNKVEIASIIATGNLNEKNLVYEIFMNYYNVRTDNEVLKKLCQDLSLDDIGCLCNRLFSVDFDKIDTSLMKVYMVLGECFGKNEIPEYMMGMSNIVVTILSKENHPCKQLAKQWINKTIKNK